MRKDFLIKVVNFVEIIISWVGSFLIVEIG